MDGKNNPIYSATTGPNGTVTVSIPTTNLTGGYKYTIKLSYNGKGDNAPCAGECYITVNNPPIPVPTTITTELSGNDVSGVVGEDVTFTVTLSTTTGRLISGKTISFTVNGKTYTATTDSAGQATITVSGLSAGTYSVSYKFGGDSTYSSSRGSNTITISESATSKITGSFDSSNNHYKLNLTSNGKPLSGQTITVTVSNGTNTITYTVTTDSNGIGTLDLSNYPKGNYSITWNYPGTDTISGTNGSSKFTISSTKLSTNLTTDSTITITYPGSGTYTVTLTDVNGKVLTNEVVSVTIVNGTKSTTFDYVTDSSGKVTVLLDNYGIGTYTITSKFAGDSNYYASNVATTVLNVVNGSSMRYTNLIAYNFTETVGAGQNFTGRLLDQYGNPIVGQHIALNLTKISNGASKVYWVTTDTDGYWTLQINLAVGSYTGWASYGGSKNYYANTSGIASIIVKSADDNRTSTILTANTFKQPYGAGQNFTGKLTDNLGNPVIGQHIALNLTRLSSGASKVYWVTTDTNGEYQLAINLGLGEYTAQCSYGGTSKYTSSSASATISVIAG